MMRIMRKMPVWKASGPDNAQGYWLKNFTPLHDKLVVYLQECLDSVGSLTGWQKDKQCLSKRIRPRGILQVIINLLHAYP